MTLFTLCLILFSLWGALESLPSPAPNRIVSGENANITDFPYQVSVRLNVSSRSSRHWCGGSIIRPNVILTAAHCFLETDDPLDWEIRAGSSFHDRGGQVIKVNKVKVHEKFDEGTIDYDVAVLHLKQELVFGDAVASVQLVNKNVSYPTGAECNVTGWGDTRPHAKHSDTANEDTTILQKLVVKLRSRESCIEELPNNTITPRMICAGGEKGKGPCYGDSGGALVIDGIQIGIVSFGGGGCARPTPGVYANVAELREWIDLNTNNY